VKNTLKGLSFNILKNTVMKDMPSKLKRHLKQSLIDGGSKIEILPFLLTKINGYVLPSYILEEDLQSFASFKTLPSDVFIASYPKSGILWLLEIVHSITKSKDTEKQDFPPIFELADNEQLETLSSPRCMLTNLPFALVPHHNEKNVKYIYIARNPRDVAVSQYHFFQEMPTFVSQSSKNTYTWAEFLAYFIKGEVPGGLYFDHVLEWWNHKEDTNVLFVKYEDMQKDLQGQVKIIAEFLGFQLSEQQIKTVAEKCTFPAMKLNPNPAIHKIPEFSKKGLRLRKGIVGDWKNYFSEQQLEQFQQLYESCMNGTDLDFEFQM
jgi:hypothetical protein